MTIRDSITSSYDFPKAMYAGAAFRNLGRRGSASAALYLSEFGLLIYYSHKHSHTGRKKRKLMDVDAMVKLWHNVVVGLAVAHSKDEADRYEASIEECLSPMLTAPIKQLREFAPKLLEALKNDPAVPFLVWRAYAIWIETNFQTATDESVKVLKMDLAKQIADLIEEDVKAQLPEALIRALQWRDPAKLEEVKKVVEDEKAKGNKVRLRGRESCLFVEAGGTEDEPKVCIQV